MNKNCPLITGGVGFTVLFTGIICSWYAFPKIIDYKIAEKLALVEGNDGYNIWKKQPFPLKFKAYFFNVSNPDEVQNGENPIVREIGPYIYDEYWERVNITIDAEADTIKYMLKRSFTFNQKESGCRSDTDFLTIVNGALVSTALQVYLILPSAMETINDAVPFLYKGAKDVFLRATVKEILFDGILITCHDPDVEFICGAMKGMLPPTMEFTNNGKDFKFSLFAYMNNTLAGPFLIGRGLKNTTRGQILEYKNSKSVAVWAGPECNMINGSDSTLFTPLKAPPPRMFVFSSDICRSMFVEYERDVTYNDISTWRYCNTKESMDWRGPNDCFCPRVKDEDYEDVPKCPKSGLFDITLCVKGPIFLSNPHFYLGDPSLVDFVKGLNPQKKLHENYMLFEPITGNPLIGTKRIQMNVELRRFEDFTLLNNVSEGIMPMMWIEEGAQIPEDLVKELKTGLNQMGMVDIFKWAMIVVGVGTMVCSFMMVMFRERLLCFAKLASGKVTITEVKETRHSDGNNLNSTVLYPSLYPQVDNKNVNDRVVQRNTLNTISQNTWQLKN